MAHAHESNVGRIWKIFGLLSLVTGIEVWLGIIKPDFLYFPWLKPFEGGFLSAIGNFFLAPVIYTSPLNTIFIVLTLVKAYYITWTFMHMEGEKKWFRRSVVWTAVFLIIYLVTLILIEGEYLYDVMSPYVKWSY